MKMDRSNPFCFTAVLTFYLICQFWALPNSTANENMMSKIWTIGDKKNYLIERKTLWEKEKLLVTSNFPFSHNVFKSCLELTSQNEYLWSKGLSQEI